MGNSVQKTSLSIAIITIKQEFVFAHSSSATLNNVVKHIKINNNVRRHNTCGTAIITGNDQYILHTHSSILNHLLYTKTYDDMIMLSILYSITTHFYIKIFNNQKGKHYAKVEGKVCV